MTSRSESWETPVFASKTIAIKGKLIMQYNAGSDSSLLYLNSCPCSCERRESRSRRRALLMHMLIANDSRPPACLPARSPDPD